MSLKLEGCKCKYCGYTWASSSIQEVCSKPKCQKKAKNEAMEQHIGDLQYLADMEEKAIAAHIKKHPIFESIAMYNQVGQSEKQEKPVEKETSALNNQVAGDHYKKLGDYQPWQVADKWLTADEFRGAAKLTILSYLCRERDKGGIEDIRKAVHTGQIFLELWDKRQAAEADKQFEQQEITDGNGSTK